MDLGKEKLRREAKAEREGESEACLAFVYGRSYVKKRLAGES